MALPRITHPLIRSDKAAAELAGGMRGGGGMNEQRCASSLHAFAIRRRGNVYRSSHRGRPHQNTELAGEMRRAGAVRSRRRLGNLERKSVGGAGLAALALAGLPQARLQMLGKAQHHRLNLL